MKVLLGATAAVFLMASPALAQTGQAPSCQNYAAAPTVPDGATASREEMTASRDAVAAWDAALVAQINACKGELRALNDAADAANTARLATVASVSTETQEFNARGNNAPAERERRRGGVLTRPDH